MVKKERVSRLLNLTEARIFLGIKSSVTLHKIIELHNIPTVKILDDIKLDVLDLELFIKSQKVSK